MTHWRVTWDIDVEDAPTPQEAAARALEIQRNPTSTATVFSVQRFTDRGEPADEPPTTVDLDDE